MLAEALIGKMAREGWDLSTALQIDTIEPQRAGPLPFILNENKCGIGQIDDAEGKLSLIYQAVGTCGGKPIHIYGPKDFAKAIDALPRGKGRVAVASVRALGFATIAGTTIQMFACDDAKSVREA